MPHILRVENNVIIGDILRKVAFLHLNEVDEEQVTEILHKQPNGLIIILPQKIENQERWQSLQEFFCTYLPNYHRCGDIPYTNIFCI